ncbi:MAG: SdiA-regulated domain-containing protein, partial [Candidatus Cloacimonadota bacterium]|nr:SdiA-regulated domain-containing protein [Candidatus Cloacimonadota bacterium]
MKKLLYLIILLYLIGCNLSESAEPNPPIYSLIYESNIEIDVPEPSGLTYDSNTNTLWTVSDHSGKIYQLDLNGNVLQILPFVGEDLEGIAYDYTNNSFWVIEEGGRNLV